MPARFFCDETDLALGKALEETHGEDIVYPGPDLARGAIPTWLRRAVSPESFVMLPVVVNGVCIGAIYCDFTSPDKNQYRYILEGFDSDWIDGDLFRRATYTSLPSGAMTPGG